MKTIKILIILLFLISISHAEITRYSINDFSGGLNTKVSANRLPKNQCSAAINVLFDEKPGSVVVRDGYTLVSSTSARELWQYPKANGQLYLMKHYQGALSYSLDYGVSWTAITTGLKWELGRIRATVYDDKFFVFDGISDVGVFDGTDWNTYSFIPKGKYPATSKNKLFIANTWDNPDHIYYNTDGSDPISKDSWLADNYEVIGYKDGDIITGLSEYRNQLIIPKRYSLNAILGYHPDSWRVIKLNSEYGCMQQESISVDKGILKFMSASGLKGYAGSGVFDIDYLIRDKILDSNNLTGEYNYLQITNSSDFDDGTYNLRVSTTANELKLDKYSYTWSADTFTYGTTVNIAVKDIGIQLSTTTSSGVSRYQTGNPANTVRTLLSNGVRVFNYVTGKWVDEWREDNDSSYLNWDIFDNLHNIVDIVADVSDFINTYAENTVSRIGGTTMREGDASPWHFAANPEYIFEFNAPGSDGEGVLLDRIEVKFDSSFSKYAIHTWDASIYHTGTTYTTLYLRVVLDYRAGGKRTITVPLKRISITELANSGHRDIGTLFTNYITGNTITININESKKVDKVALTFYTSTGLNFHVEIGPGKGLFSFEINLSRVYDISIYEKTSEPVHKTTGTYTSNTSDKISDYNVKWGTITFDAYTNYSAEGTTLAYRTRTSTQTSTPIDTWSSWSDWSSTPTFKITSPIGKYIQFRSSYTTTLSSYTAIIYSVSITATASTGTWIGKQYNIGKVKGGWSYVIFDTDLNSQTANFWVRLGTGATDLTNTAWSSITSGSLISGTTNENWIQYKVGLETTDGTQNPIVRSLTSVYAPESAPVIAQAISIQDRWHIAISTSGDTNNSTVLVQDKNNAWTLFEIDVDGWTKFGQDVLFSNSNGIFKMYDGTTDSGTIITSKWEKVLNFGDNTFDKQMEYIYTVGQNKSSSGSLDISYKIENSTINYTTNNIDTGSTGIFRHKQPINKSAVNYITLKLSATSYFEVNGIDVWHTPIMDFVK